MTKKMLFKCTLVISFCLGLLSFGCKEKRFVPNERAFLNTAVLIYNSYLKDSLSLTKEPGGPIARLKPIVSYYNPDSLYNETILVNDSKSYIDTVRISMTDNFLTLRHTYNLDDYYFTIKGGDTLVFDDSSDLPSYIESNTKNNSKDRNLFYTATQGFTKYASNNFGYFVVFDAIFNGRNDNEVLEEYNRIQKYRYSKNIKILDSLWSNQLISKRANFLYKLQSKFDFLNLNKELRDVSGNDAISFIEVNYNVDSLLVYKFYRSFLIKEAELIYEIPFIKVSDGSIIDSKMAFDSISKNNDFRGKSKNFLLHHYLTSIAAEATNKTLRAYVNRFLRETKDSNATKDLKDKYLLDLSKLKEESGHTYLINSQKERFTLKSVLEKYKNKIIYIDFWASWCRPCREAMPKSRELRKFYKEEEVVFLYFSIDKDYDQWINASEKEKLANYENNLLAVNYPKSEFYPFLDLKTIPRYLIYDKNGVLINKKAPGPESLHIYDLLNSILTKNN